MVNFVGKPRRVRRILFAATKIYVCATISLDWAAKGNRTVFSPILALERSYRTTLRCTLLVVDVGFWLRKLLILYGQAGTDQKLETQRKPRKIDTTQLAEMCGAKQRTEQKLHTVLFYMCGCTWMAEGKFSARFSHAYQEKKKLKQKQWNRYQKNQRNKTAFPLENDNDANRSELHCIFQTRKKKTTTPFLTLGEKISHCFTLSP